MNKLNFSKSPIAGKSTEGIGLKQSFSVEPTNRSCLDKIADKITPTLRIGEYETCCSSWKVDGDHIIYTFAD